MNVVKTPDMENIDQFNFHEYIQNWSQNLKNKPSFTDSNVEELKNHFPDSIDDLKAKGLDEEKACYIASRRMGSSFEWEDDFKSENNSFIQLRKSVLLLSGIIAYFFVYYLILFTSKLFLLTLLISGENGFEAVGWIGRYLISIHFVFIIGTVSLYFLESRAVNFISKLEITTKKVVSFLLIAFFTGICNTTIFPVVKNFLKGDLAARSYLYRDYQYFDYSFPILVCFCFLFLYLIFNMKNSY